MIFRYVLRLFVIVSIAILFSSCSIVDGFLPTPTSTVTQTPTNTPLPPTFTPTPTEVPFYLTATYFSGDLQVPILLYHRFIPDSDTKSASTYMHFSEFRNELQILYDNGFSVISLKSWLDGTFMVPAGRRPVIITMDDLWFADQLYINEDNRPSELSGLGVMWKFAQEYPDFGFHAAVFSNMGDKQYGDKQVGEHFFVGENIDGMWQKLALTMVWAIENGIEPYNHLFYHPQLSKTENVDILFNIKENDRVTRYYLSLVDREDLIPQLGNIIALPYGEWPSSTSGVNIIKNYKNQEGMPLQAIFEAYNLTEAKLTPSVFTPGFDPYNLARITASEAMIQWVVEQKEFIPAALTCQLGPLEVEQANDTKLVKELIQEAVQTGTCPEGIYHVESQIYNSLDGAVSLYTTPGEAEILSLGDITPTP